jgi:hypothetical protein
MIQIPPDAKRSVSAKPKRGRMVRFIFAIGRWIARVWLLLFFIVVGAILVLSQSEAARILAPTDAAIVAWWRNISGTLSNAEHPGIGGLLTDHFFAEVGIAFIIAGLVGIFVESILRRQEERKREQYLLADTARHQNQVAELEKNVFKSVLGNLSPEWMAGKVIDLYRAAFLRQGLHVAYSFEPPPTTLEPLGHHATPLATELITVRVHIGYYLINLTDTEMPCEFGHGFEPTVPIAGNSNRFTKLSVRRPPNPGQGGVGAAKPSVIGRPPDEGTVRRGLPEELEWQEGQINQYIECATNAETESLRWKSQTIAVRNFRIGATNKMRVDVEHQSVRWRYDHDTWVSRLPAETLRITANVAEGIPALEFFLDQSHPKRFRQVAPGEWELNDAVLPFQGFTLHWFPAAQKNPPDASP